MKIDLVTVESPWKVEHQDGTVEIERGTVLMGDIFGDIFFYPLTIADKRVECFEFFYNKRILPVMEGITAH